MTPEQAEQLLRDTCSRIAMPLADHQRLQAAISVLKRAKDFVSNAGGLTVESPAENLAHQATQDTE